MNSWKQGLATLTRGKELVLAFTAGLYLGVVGVIWSFTLSSGPPNPSAYTLSTAAIASVVVLAAWLGLFGYFIWTDTNSRDAVDT